MEKRMFTIEKGHPKMEEKDKPLEKCSRGTGTDNSQKKECK